MCKSRRRAPVRKPARLQVLPPPRTLQASTRTTGAPDKAHCAPWLERELLAVRPRVVILLGRHAAPFFLKRYAGVDVDRIDKVVARPFTCRLGGFETMAVPTLHPTGAQMAPGGSPAVYMKTAHVVRELLAPT
ncbi:MAG: uracil-DNA glycosylase family protein [Gaiellaceae bacterium]